ncbi:MAG TPA: GtrA family protein [Acidimicrobiales bacterium]|nr:GtrA family protein [Acidimicrobiales bacterium]
MRSVLDKVLERSRTPGGQKAFRYMVVSAVSVGVSQVALFGAFAGLHWTARSSNLLAFVVGGVPSYWLNRRWTWGRTGRSHLLKEVAPFWALAFTGLAFSTWAAHAAERWALDVADSRLVQALIVNGSVIAAFGVLWIVKFFMFNKVLFVTKDEDLRAALADEIVA